MVGRSWAWWLGASGLVVLAAVAAMVVAAPDATATHYRGGTLQWHRIETGSTVDGLTQVSLTGELAYNSTFYYPMFYPRAFPIVGDVIPGLDCCDSIYWGDGGSTHFDMLVTYADVPKQTIYVRIVAPGTLGDLSHTYRLPNNYGKPYLVNWGSGDRLSLGGGHVNNPEGWYLLTTNVDLLNPNHSPVATLEPERACYIDTVCRFSIDASDADREPLRYRLATSAEAAGTAYPSKPFVQPGPPSAANPVAIDAQTGIVTWDTHGATLASPRTYYSMQVMVEDNATNVPLDFFLRIDARPPAVTTFTATMVSPCGGGAVQFHDVSQASAPATVAAWQWDFGDGTQSVEKDPQHEYPAAGTYTVRLTVIDSDGITATTASTVRVAAKACPQPATPPVDGSTRPPAPRDGVDARQAESDADKDGVPDRLDPCPLTAGDQADADGDGVGDACDFDVDGDTIPDSIDDCVADADPFQRDLDLDGIGDECDDDRDGDGVANGADPCPELAGITPQASGGPCFAPAPAHAVPGPARSTPLARLAGEAVTPAARGGLAWWWVALVCVAGLGLCLLPLARRGRQDPP